MLSKEQLATLRRARVSGRNRTGKARELLGLTQVQLADALGLTQGYVSRIEKGRYADVPGETMRRFARFFGCTMDDLFPTKNGVAA